MVAPPAGDPGGSPGDQPADESGGAGGDWPVAPTRRESRERALGLLYAAEAQSVTPAEVLAAQVVTPDPYAGALVAGVGDHLADLDATISANLAGGWELSRLPAIDRAVLRLGVYELAHRSDIPTAVVLNEAVELAKGFSTEDSGRFVNGVLAAVARQERPDTVD